MAKNKRFVFSVLIVTLLLALPTTALAAKRIYQADLTTDAELHEVIGSSAQGSATFGANPGGSSLHFELKVFGLSGGATSAHIHLPATPEQNAPVVVTLCGGPPPAVVATCPFDNGAMIFDGNIGGSLPQGVTPAQFFNALNSGLAYVNVHTALNPAGEVRGQIYQQ
jgi:hypothetical protein